MVFPVIFWYSNWSFWISTGLDKGKFGSATERMYWRFELVSLISIHVSSLSLHILYLQCHVKKPSLESLIKYTFTLVLYLLLTGKPDWADDKKECTMVKLMSFLHVLKPTWKFENWKRYRPEKWKNIFIMCDPVWAHIVYFTSTNCIHFTTFTIYTISTFQFLKGKESH